MSAPTVPIDTKDYKACELKDQNPTGLAFNHLPLEIQALDREIAENRARIAQFWGITRYASGTFGEIVEDFLRLADKWTNAEVFEISQEIYKLNITQVVPTVGAHRIMRNTKTSFRLRMWLMFKIFGADAGKSKANRHMFMNWPHTDQDMEAAKCLQKKQQEGGKHVDMGEDVRICDTTVAEETSHKRRTDEDAGTQHPAKILKATGEPPYPLPDHCSDGYSDPAQMQNIVADIIVADKSGPDRSYREIGELAEKCVQFEIAKRESKTNPSVLVHALEEEIWCMYNTVKKDIKYMQQAVHNAVTDMDITIDNTLDQLYEQIGVALRAV